MKYGVQSTGNQSKSQIKSMITSVPYTDWATLARFMTRWVWSLGFGSAIPENEEISNNFSYIESSILGKCIF